MRQLVITRQITNRGADSLDKYFHEINKEQLISAKEEVTLAKRIKDGDEKAMEKLIRANLRFVVSVAKQYQNRGLALSDLINEGNIGLVKAARRYDETRGFKLISYAVWYIRRSIQEAIINQSQLVRIPSNKKSAINKIRKMVTKMEQQFQREPSYEEIGKELFLTEGDVKEAMNFSSRHVSMDAPIAGNEDITMMDALQDKDAEKTDHEVIAKSLRKEIMTVMATLSPREAEVLCLYFGFNQTKPMTFEEIGDHFGLSRERIAQIKEKAIRKLRHTSRCKILREYLD